MSASHSPVLAALTAFSKDQIQQAGQRYTPGIDPEAPNLRIKSLFTAIENVACGAGARARFQSVLDAFSEAWDRAKHCSQGPEVLRQRAEEARAFLSPMIDRLRAGEAGAGEEWSSLLFRIERGLLADSNHWLAEEAKLQPADRDGGYSSTRNTIRDNLSAIDRCLAIVRAEKEYIQSPAFKVLFDPNLLVNGEWGTGKTHLMCDFAEDRLGRRQAVVFVLAKNFQGSVVAEICSRIDTERTAAEVLDQLEELAHQTGERVVIILDGVNEGRRHEWRDAVTMLQALVADRPRIGLIVTCRTPFEPIAIKQKDLDRFHKVTHVGFDDQEFDAQAAFFQYYNLPLPEVPLLDREFSRPLTLKLICQSLQKLGRKKLARGFAGIASGQKGMTYVLESFVSQVGKPIEHEFGLGAKGCWGLLKGNDRVAVRSMAGFAPCMAAKLRGFVRPSEADRIIAANYPALRPTQRRQLLEVLRTSGLIEEDALWYSTKSGFKSRVVFRLPYQRFSDHLIARHLLKAHLDVSSAATIRRSFTGKSPLARIFGVSSRRGREYEEPGWAQAVITEFPERVGKRLPANQRELFFVLPEKAQNLGAYFDPFIEGVFWRDPAAFTEGTRAIINQYLNAGPWAWERMVDALAAVSTKPKHPYHARNATHHTLMRDYALGIIEIAQRVSCVALPGTAVRDLTPPFPNTPSAFTSDGRSDSTVKEAIGDAIRMDFGNYTIGRLIRDRANYDEHNADYVEVRAKIERRMLDLGYGAERFKEADADIGDSSWRTRDQEKVDRYGKKYSWIAYFEMWGEREAVRQLPDWCAGERTSDCGVDPSFPTRPPQWTPPIPDLFGDRSAATQAWVEGGFTPSWDPLLAVPEINGHQGEWVLVEGFVRGADESQDRELLAFLRGVFIARREVHNLRAKFLSVEYPGNRVLPGGGTEYYLYAGEAGRRQNFAPRLYQRNGRYRRQIVEAFDEYVPVHRGEKAPGSTVSVRSTPREGGETGKASFEVLGPFPEMRHVPGIRLEIPYIHFGWESYHSSHNDFSGFNLPAPSLIQRLRLASKYREIDFYDSNGEPGTLYREAGDGWEGDRHSLLYVRADLLRRYLTDTRQVLVWCNWGERNWLRKMEGLEAIRDSRRERIYRAYEHIHRSFLRWSAVDRKIV